MIRLAKISFCLMICLVFLFIIRVFSFLQLQVYVVKVQALHTSINATVQDFFAINNHFPAPMNQNFLRSAGKPPLLGCLI